MGQFDDKVAIVTGAGGGIGQAYAEALARESGQAIAEPTKLIAPMLARFMATDRAFTKNRRTTQARSTGGG